MGIIFSYTIYSGVFLIMLFLLFKVFVSGEKQIVLNRFLLLMCYAFSFLAWPISRIDWKTADVGTQFVAMIGEFTFQPITIQEQSSSIIPRILIWIYLGGAVSVLLISLFSIVRLFCYLRKGTLYRHKEYDLIVMPDHETAPFSIGRYIVMSSSDYETVRDMVVSHELAHIRCRHYIDLIFAQMVCVMLWYNPAAWLMRGELKLIHEYQADSKVLERGVNPTSYQLLLIRKSVGNRFHTLANNLNHSKLKNRISMMQKENGGIFSRMRVLALAIAPAAALAIVNNPAVAAGLRSLDEATLNEQSLSIRDSDASNAIASESVTITSDDVIKKRSNEDNDSLRVIAVAAVKKNADGSSGELVFVKKTENLKELNDGNQVVGTTDKKYVLIVNGKEYSGTLNSIPKDQIESITVQNFTSGSPDAIIDVKMKNDYALTGSINVNSMKIVVGPGHEGKNCQEENGQAVRINGKLVKERVELDPNDIELCEVFQPTDEYPHGLIEITLKNK